MNKILKNIVMGTLAVILTVGLSVALFSTTKVVAQPSGGLVNNYFNPVPAVYALATNNTPSYQAAGWTNYIGGTGVFENDTPIDTSGAKDVALQFKFRCSGANSGAITVALGRSNTLGAGTTNIELFTAFTATANGTAQVIMNTNLSTANNLWGAYRYLYVMYITNGGATTGGLTNYTITPWLK